MKKKKKLTQAQFLKRAKNIKLILLDVDGVLTDGRIFFSNIGWTRIYHIHDGYGIRMIQRLGIPVGIMSGGQSDELKERIKILDIKHSILGSENKLESLITLSEEVSIDFKSILFMGDDLFDLPALQKVGLSVSVPNAMDEVKASVDYVTKKSGGKGAVREVIDLIRKAQNLGF